MLSLSVNLKPTPAAKPEPPTKKRIRRTIYAKTKSAAYKKVFRMCGTNGALTG